MARDDCRARGPELTLPPDRKPDAPRPAEGGRRLHSPLKEITLSNLEADRLQRRPAAFLDRDGVLNIDHGYTYRPEDLEFTPTAIEAVHLLNEAQYRVFVVTNQSGVARGYYTTEDVERFHAHMQSRLIAGGARVDAYYICPYHPDGSVPEYAIHHDDRKPGPGMLLRAMREWPTDKAASVMIGDKRSDLEAAERAGVQGILVPQDVCDLAAVVRAFLETVGGGRVAAAAS